MTDEARAEINSSSMADISGKKTSRRRALASGKIMLGEEAFQLVRERSLPKGDALSLAEYAGIPFADLMTWMVEDAGCGR